MSRPRTSVLGDLGRAVRVDRHALGPRLLVGGRRVHEWHFGVLGLVAAAVTSAMGVAGGLPLAALVRAGVWLVVKDWRDVHPATRDTAAWSLGVHRVSPLRDATAQVIADADVRDVAASVAAVHRVDRRRSRQLSAGGHGKHVARTYLSRAYAASRSDAALRNAASWG